VGRLTAIKRPDRLIKAMELVLEHRPDAVLGVVGEGELLTTTERLAEPLGPAVRFLGWQPDIAALYAAADCVVLTSDSEGMPVTLIEAAFAGVPGVTTDVGSAGEVVLDGLTGLVVEANAEAVANGLIRILENDLCFRMGEAAKERAEAVFSTTRLVSSHEALYRNLITGQATLDRQANDG
jgi:glycosyltransferase involved in cell wall biosynthesis